MRRVLPICVVLVLGTLPVSEAKTELRLDPTRCDPKGACCPLESGRVADTNLTHWDACFEEERWEWASPLEA